MTTLQYSPGLYGKVPALGDFVTRRLPAHFVRPWDDWLQAALSTSREQLRTAWLDFYMISPIWRFVISPGICGPVAWAGILMPSVDKVNRYFPLTLAVSVQQQEILPWLFSARDDWFEQLEDLALSTLEGKLDVETLDRELQRMIVMPFLPGSDGYSEAQRIGEKKDGFAFRIEMGGMSKVRDAFACLAACVLTEYVPAYSLWCTNGSEWVKPALAAYGGLPPAYEYAKLLTGRWQQGEWSEWIASQASILKSDREAAVNLRTTDTTLDIPHVEWCSNSATTVGCVRKANQDSFLERREIGLWAVADGLGGHLRGDLASKAVVSALSEIPPMNSLDSMIDAVRERMRGVNRDLIEMAAGYGIGKTMGSTAVIMLAFGSNCAAIWLGDSRLYRYREGGLAQITQDHSLVAALNRFGANVEDELAGKNISNLLTKALGSSPDVEADTITFDARKGDLYLLCSDGLIREASDDEIADILSKNDFKDTARKLVDLALERGARDNVTVVTVWWNLE